jgi:hypothetical protein
MYIAADGRAYPCCNTGYHYNGYKNNMNIEIVDVQAEQQVYSIKTHKLSELIEGDFFNTIQTRWDTNPIRKCVRTCGVTRDNLHKVESL